MGLDLRRSRSSGLHRPPPLCTLANRPPPALAPAAAALLAQRAAIANWGAFAAANAISGWTAESAASLCTGGWTGVACNAAGRVATL